MEAQQLLSDAITLMLLGMGTVFVFLTLLVWLTGLMSLLVNRLVPVRPAAPVVPGAQPPPADTDLPAVIAAAIHAHRSRR